MAEESEPEVIQDVFALYRRVAAETIEELGGRVLQFQGDGVVACFGYPVAHEDDARRAVLAGLRLIERMEHAGIELKRLHDIEPAIRVGVHSGTVVIAGLASGVIDGSALAGSVPNVASRVQGETEPGTVCISETTEQLVAPHFELRSLGTPLPQRHSAPHGAAPGGAIEADRRTLESRAARVGSPGRPREPEPAAPLHLEPARPRQRQRQRRRRPRRPWSSCGAWPASGNRRWRQSWRRTYGLKAALCSRPTARRITAMSRCGRLGACSSSCSASTRTSRQRIGSPNWSNG